MTVMTGNMAAGKKLSGALLNNLYTYLQIGGRKNVLIENGMVF